MLPFATQLSTDGLMEPHGLVVRRRMSDMATAYADGGAAAALAGAEDPVVYLAYEAAVPHEDSHLVYRTTIVRPGEVGGEYFMTKGHHHVRDSAEFYYGMAGNGVLLMETRDGRMHEEEMPPGRAVYVPPGWAHRTVNVGRDDFVFLAVFLGDAGHDYASIEERGFGTRVRAGADGYEFVRTGDSASVGRRPTGHGEGGRAG